MRTVTIPVEGMTCAACAGRVRRTVHDIPGVASVEADLAGRKTRAWGKKRNDASHDPAGYQFASEGQTLAALRKTWS